MQYVSFRDMTNHSHTPAEVKAFAKDFEMVDSEPDENGEEVIRACVHSDKIPK